MNILIATATSGAGHVQAAAALEEAWRAFQPQSTVERLDVLDFTPKLYRTLYAQGYLKMVEHTPELWGMFFDRTDKPALTRKLTRLRHGLAKVTAAKFRRHVKRLQPDAVLCTHFMPLEVLGDIKGCSANAWEPFITCVVTDFEAHALWMEPNVDLYCVAAEETKARLVARGAAADGVAVTGIPVAGKFGQPLAVPAVRRALGLRDDLFTLLVLGSALGTGPVAEILTELNRLKAPMQVLVVCGRNEEVRRTAATVERLHPTHLFGFVTNMHELMAAADLILTKPGGVTSSEALALGKPLFILNPIPGQEAANSDFLLEHGAAAKANRVQDLPFRLNRLIGSAKLAEMARAAKALGRPNAAADICQRVWQQVKPAAALPIRR
jgi:processive 1,2-diacylglycerol beta-glucosyltransferase